MALDKIDFEKSLGELEKIIAKLESGECTLEESISLFEQGMKHTDAYQVIENRVEAICWALDHAQKDDVIVLCGKGHEDYQEIGHQKVHLDEREVIAEYLKKSLLV